MDQRGSECDILPIMEVKLIEENYSQYKFIQIFEYNDRKIFITIIQILAHYHRKFRDSLQK